MEYQINFGGEYTATIYAQYGQNIQYTYAFKNYGSSYIKVKARLAQQDAKWSPERYITINVQPAPAPTSLAKVSGRTSIYEDMSYSWGFRSYTSGIEDDITYSISFGDGSSTTFGGKSGQTAYVSHTYYNRGSYTMTGMISPSNLPVYVVSKSALNV